MTRQLIVVGACYSDTILSVPHFPVEDEKLRATAFEQRRGGNGPNTLEVLQQLLKEQNENDIKLFLCSVLPGRSSLATQQVQSSFSEIVNLDHCVYREEHTEPASSYIVKNTESGSRTIVNYNALPEMTLDEFKLVAEALAGPSSWYHFEGRIPDVTLECIKYLRKSASTIISVEVEKPGRAGLEDLAAEADIVFYSRGWAQSRGYRNAEECLRDQAILTRRTFATCCTWGDEGAAAMDLSQNICHIEPAYIIPNTKIKDTTGAGDTFVAGMLFSLLCHRNDWSLEKKLRFSVELAGRKVVQNGFSNLTVDMSLE